ncbi:MAG: molybdopterin-dependent oxidoreductase, partial [Gemmatimonadetes bacterium]|nr:molybdopterin-dependent oxidoreductase [Gemmatimonadota bacterium]NIR84120.1 molybdopterin-dependent oxidoreductase [Gammaproteobacteria bacterium]NIT67418.1 molybdopterin-dependent oxidoreductase [Gemmatimonadota bacterium]NIV24125.1 molybdopterin-dependent oxidoreductase [Gemmatimonadota bacterium]NIW76035.1 molybdopterin-dependent oxidoreductase [Gemmatimonadota bacterium]
ITDTAAANAPDAPAVYDECPDNVSFVQSIGDREGAEAGFERAAHVIRHRFIINRVAANTLEPRACIGDYDAAEDH